MARTTRQQALARRVWALARAQHGVVSRHQLLALGFTREAIAQRLGRGRLHGVHRGVYAVGRPELSRYGQMFAAVLACGPDAVVSHETGAELWRVRRRGHRPIEVSIATDRHLERPGLAVHRRSILADDAVDVHERVPVTSVTLTLVDLAARMRPRHLEAAVNMADSLDLLDAERLRDTLERYPSVSGVAILRDLLDRDTFVLTDSELERMFLALVDGSGLPRPKGQHRLSGHRVDFVWPEVDLVVETDSLRYHRTAIQQRRDVVRDHDHLLAERESVRFTHHQVAHEKTHVRRTLIAAYRRADALKRLR